MPQPSALRLLLRQQPYQGLEAGAVAGEDLVVAGGVEMGDEPRAVPMVDCEPGRVGDDHRAVVGAVGVDRLEIEGDLRGGGGADGQGRSRPLRDDRTVEMAGDDGDDVVLRRHDGLEPLHPFRLGILGHPAVAALDRRVVEDEQGGAARGLGEPLPQPGRPGLAEGAAVAAFLEGVEDEDAQAAGLDRILVEAVGHRGVGEIGPEGFAPVVVAERVVDREGQARDGLPEPGVGQGIVAGVGEVAGGEEEVRPGHHLREGAQGPVEPLAVELVGIALVEAEMDVGDLGDQDHRRAPATTRSRFLPLTFRRIVIDGAPASI